MFARLHLHARRSLHALARPRRLGASSPQPSSLRSRRPTVSASELERLYMYGTLLRVR